MRGNWIIRIEDLDRPRVLPGYAERQVEQLRLFGLSPDGEIVFQSKRIALYDRFFERLRKAGLVYPCRCSRKEIASAASAPHGPEGPRYPGTCRGGVPEGEARAWRFRVPEGAVGFRDSVFGTISQDVSDLVGDFVIRRERPDRSYSYQFAVVVDDAEQGVTQVVRGADLLDSTSRQIALHTALGLPVPSYAHVPLLVEADGTKLSKRLGLRELAPDAGPAARERILARLLELLGQAPTLEKALAHFDASRIPRRKTIEVGPRLS